MICTHEIFLKKIEMFKQTSTYRYAAWLSLVAIFSGCAATSATNNHVLSDPLEPMNRAVFRFNDELDKIVIQPVARAYRAVLPTGLRNVVSNVFSNVGEVFNIANNLLQGKPVETAESFMRFTINTVFGLGGTMDIATLMHLNAHKQDFGVTLGVWGIPTGPYLVLPLLGPSSLRDTVGTAAHFIVDPVNNYSNVPVRNTASGVRLVNARANLLDAGKLLDAAALDKYSFVRDAYLQRRNYQVKGDVASDEEDSEKMNNDDANDIDTPELDGSDGQENEK